MSTKISCISLYQEVDLTSGSYNDIILQTVDFRTGLELNKKRYLGSSQSQPIFMVVNHLGIFMLANIENGFKDLSSADSFTTQNSQTNFGIIHADYDGNIIEIESYDTSDSANDLGAEYPKRLVVGVQNKHQPIFTFLSARDEQNDYQGGGVFITQPANNSALFAVGDSLASCSSVTPNCELCSSNGWFKCTSGYKIQNGECKLSWDTGFFQVRDDTNDALDIDICLPCHKSCLTCSDSTETGWLSWDSDKLIDNTKGTWEWNQSSGPKFMGVDGTWTSTCGNLLPAKYDKKCVKTCPENSDDYLQKIDTVNPRAKSSQTNCQSLTKHFKVEEGITDIPSFGESLLSRKNSYTMTLWVKVTETTNGEFTITSSSKFSVNFRYNIDNWSIQQLWLYSQSESTVLGLSVKLFLEKLHSQLHLWDWWVGLHWSFSLQNQQNWRAVWYSYCDKDTNRELKTQFLSLEKVCHLIALMSFNLFKIWLLFLLEDLKLIILVLLYLQQRACSQVPNLVQPIGLYNKIMAYEHPMTTVELLNNALRLPVREVRTYDPDLLYSFTIYDDTTAKGLADTEQILDIINQKEGFSNTEEGNKVTTEDSLSDPLNFCQFYTIEVSLLSQI